MVARVVPPVNVSAIYYTVQHENYFSLSTFYCVGAGPLKVPKEILAAGKGTEGAEMCLVKTITKPGSQLICFCHSSIQKKSTLSLSYNNNITKVLHTFLWSGGMFTK